HAIAEQGWRGLTLARLIELRDHGVDGGYLDGMRRIGFRNLTMEDALEARTHGVDAGFLSSLADEGYDHLTIRDAIRARDHGVDAGFAAEAKRRLGRTPPLDELIRLRDTGELKD